MIIGSVVMIKQLAKYLRSTTPLYESILLLIDKQPTRPYDIMYVCMHACL